MSESKSLLSRRGFLKVMGGTAAAVLATPSVASSKISAPLILKPELERKLVLNNLHTGEKLSAVYWADGEYQPEVMLQLNALLRDHRSNSSTEMDRRLYDLLHRLQKESGVNREFQIISAYRSPETNQMLAKRNGKVARKSYHMKGQALDIRVPGMNLRNLHKTAVRQKLGGVGFYSRSNFIHVDVGPVRYWS